MDFTQFNSRLKSVIDNLDTIVLDSAMDNKELIADLNVMQLEQGKRNDSKNIVPKYRSKPYAQFKKSIGAKPPLGTPNLILEGGFTSGIYSAKKKDYIYNWSKDEKVDRLNAKYPKVLGLTDDSQSELNKQTAPTLVKRLKNGLFGG